MITIVGIGGYTDYPGGFLPDLFAGIFPPRPPSIATAAVVGIMLNLMLLAFPPPAGVNLRASWVHWLSAKVVHSQR